MSMKSEMSMTSMTSTTKNAALIRWAAVASCASLLVTACVPDRALRVRQLVVVGEDDNGPLELEVHMFDADSGEFLGCSGESSGLLTGGEPGSSPSMNARFWAANLSDRDGSSGKWLTDLDVLDRNVIFVVIEDDAGACPAIYTIADDLIGLSQVMPGVNLSSTTEMKFDRVSHLVIEGP